MKHSRRHRRAFTLLEVTIACLLLILCAAVVAQMLHLLARQERVTDVRQTALRAVANRMEQLQARAWDELPVAPRTAEALPAEVLQLQPRAQLWSEVLEQEDGRVREIRVQIDWPDAGGNTVQPVSLSGWKYRVASSPETQP
jgi:Tfp pilus assembly protein PilV